jgi:hypothetical protein
MKAIALFLILISSCVIAQNTINPIIGDTSWYINYGNWPFEGDSEYQRISTHLSFVLNQLRNEKNDDRSRRESLDLLEDYIQRGKFPVNMKHNERKPCFIDVNGTICAVGYLVEQTAGLKVAKKINRRFKYNYISEMKSDDLVEWQGESGLSMKELAMIQPAYGSIYVRTGNHIEIASGYSPFQKIEIEGDSYNSFLCQFDFPIKGKFSAGVSLLYQETNKEMKDRDLTLLKMGFIPTGYWYFKRGLKMEAAAYGGIGLQVRNYEQKVGSREIDLQQFGPINRVIDGRIGVLCRYYPLANKNGLFRRIGIVGSLNYGGPVATLGLTYKY